MAMGAASAVTDDADTAILIDTDLSILGAPPQVYDGYRLAVRREYAECPAFCSAGADAPSSNPSCGANGPT